jgi:uncharacterized membrane protein YqjE
MALRSTSRLVADERRVGYGLGATRPASVAREAPLGTAVRGLWTEFRGLVREHAVLAVLEAQRAGLHLAYIVAAVLVVTVLVVTAWLAGVTALAMWLLRSDVPWPGVLVLAAVLNLVGAGLVAWWAKRQMTEMPFSATLRQLSADRSEITSTGNHAQATRP